MTKIIFRYTFIFNIGQNLEQDKILELFKSTVSIFVPCIILLHVHHMINYVGNIKNLFIDYYLKFSNKKKVSVFFLKKQYLYHDSTVKLVSFLFSAYTTQVNMYTKIC